MSAPLYAMRLVLQDGQRWDAGGHEGSLLDVLPDLAHVGAWAALAGLGLFVLLAFLRRHRYRAVDVLGDAEHAALREEITAAELHSRGEIAVVVLERSDRHPAAEWICGLVIAFLGSAALAGWLPWERPALLLLCQLGLGLAGFLAARTLPDLKRRFVSPARASEMSEEQALQEFFGHGLHATKEATGVLILLSLFEHRVVVLGDAGIDGVVAPEYWTATSDAILEGVRAGKLVEGLREGIRRCGGVLAEHFPQHEGAGEDELPDHVVVRHE